MPSDLATVLVVEDEALIALDLQALLEHAAIVCWDLRTVRRWHSI